jgi:threonine synthase
LELFHGPTGSFKDFALQLFPLIFDHFAKSKTDQRGKKFAILVSTSGDTGSATMDGFCSQTEIPVVVLFPANGVSPVQRAQMVSSTFSNLRVLPIAAPADFDFCQSTLKQLFNDSSFIQQLGDEFNLSVSAANSINWGRLLPQIAYHVFAFASLVARGDVSVTELVDVCVPTGNFGNILAALYARSCGVPIGTLVCATNENDVLREFIQTGTYDIRNRSLQPTSSPSIDILKSSNLERMLHLIEGGRDGSSIASYFNDLSAPEKQSFTVKASTFEQVRALFTSGTCRQDQAVDVIKNEFQKSNVVFDPHTAVAKHVADENQPGDVAGGRPMIICATAHYVKFPSTVLHALGREASGDLKSQLTELSNIVSEAKSVPKIHDRVKDCCFADEVQSQPIAASKEAIREETLSFFRKLFN